MTEKEREFKVKMIDKYDGRIGEIKKERFPILVIGLFGLTCSMWGLLPFMDVSTNPTNDFVDIIKIIMGTVGIAGGLGISGYALADAISNIAQKANLLTEVEKLKNELELDKIINSENYVNEEERRHSRWK